MNALNQDRIHEIRKLECEIGQNLLQTLINLYTGQVPKSLTRMREAIDARDFETVRREAHSLKSSSATLGVLAAYELCRELESDCGVRNSPSRRRLNSCLNKLENALQAGIFELQTLTLPGAKP